MPFEKDQLLPDETLIISTHQQPSLQVRSNQSWYSWAVVRVRVTMLGMFIQSISPSAGACWRPGTAFR